MSDLSADFAQLTAETFVESVLDVFGDERQSPACYVHPPILLLEALAKGAPSCAFSGPVPLVM